MSGLREPPDVSVRLACPTDTDFLYALRNDSQAAANSRTPRQLSEAELRARFDPDATLTRRVVLVAERGGERVGMVRFDRVDDAFEVSIIVAPEQRGRGLGRPILSAAIDAFNAVHPHPALLADVAAENEASSRLFASLGFTEVGVTGRFKHFCLPAGRAIVAREVPEG